MPMKTPRSQRKRSRQEAPSSFAKKRARTSSKKRKSRVAPKRAYAGPLIASKSVRMAKPGARIRQRHFGNVPAANRNWIGSKTTGSEFYFSSLIAEALVAYLFKKLGNVAVDKDNTSGGSFLARVQVGFVREENQSNQTLETIRMTMITTDNSFNGLVYNTSPFNIVTRDGVTSTYRGWNQIIYEMASIGYYPAFMFAWGKDTGSTPNEHEIFRDEALDRANIKLDIQGTHKFQNVTPASASNYNANAIDANPLERKIYTFRNQQPKFQPTWLASQGTDIQALEDFTARPNWSSGEYAKINIDSTQVMPTLNVFEAPPLRPTTVFANCSKVGKTYFPPGGFKVFRTQFTYDGTFRRLVTGLTQVRSDPVTTGGKLAMGKVPPLGGCFLMCVIPTLKSLVNEPVSVAYDYEKDGKAHMTSFRAGTLPTTNFMQGTD